MIPTFSRTGKKKKIIKLSRKWTFIPKLSDNYGTRLMMRTYLGIFFLSPGTKNSEIFCNTEVKRILMKHSLTYNTGACEEFVRDRKDSAQMNVIWVSLLLNLFHLIKGLQRTETQQQTSLCNYRAKFLEGRMWRGCFS